MKVLFLDIDGVLNSRQWIKKVGYKFDDPTYQIDPDAVIRLNKITDSTGASIVVSSTWRLAFTWNLEGLKDCLRGYGITGDIIGMTPNCLSFGLTRSDEINSWLDDHLDVTSFVILDDDTLKGDLDSQVIRTNFDDGLLDCHVKAAIDKLTDVC